MDEVRGAFPTASRVCSPTPPRCKRNPTIPLREGGSPRVRHASRSHLPVIDSKTITALQ